MNKSTEIFPSFLLNASSRLWNFVCRYPSLWFYDHCCCPDIVFHEGNKTWPPEVLSVMHDSTEDVIICLWKLSYQLPYCQESPHSSHHFPSAMWMLFSADDLLQQSRGWVILLSTAQFLYCFGYLSQSTWKQSEEKEYSLTTKQPCTVCHLQKSIWIASCLISAIFVEARTFRSTCCEPPHWCCWWAHSLGIENLVPVPSANIAM